MQGSMSPNRRQLLLGLGLTGTALALDPTLGSGGAEARPRPRPRAWAGSAAADVVVAADGVTAPDTVPSGAVAFSVTTPAPRGMSVLLVRLRVPLARYLDDLARLAAATTTQETIAAVRAVEADVVNLGGAVVLAGRAATFTPVLRPGSYQLIGYDYTSDSARPLARALTVTPGGRDCPPRADDRIVQTPTGFQVRGDRLRADGAHLVENRSGLLNEAVLLPLRPGTTQADVDAYFGALSGGQPPPASPLAGQPVGLAPLSPGQRAVLRAGLPAGPYLLASWVTSSSTGRPRAFGGYNRVVTLA